MSDNFGRFFPRCVVDSSVDICVDNDLWLFVDNKLDGVITLVLSLEKVEETQRKFLEK